jgi:regulator of protease activity HflC (stomatin/prohibitin superfamily)
MAGLGVCRGRLSGRRASITRFLRTAEFSLSAARQLPKSRTNTLINFVPQQQAWVVERFGKYLKTLQPGLNVLIPVVDQIRYVQSLKEAVVDIPSQSAITEDNVTLHLDGVLYYRVIEPYLASYGVENAEYAVVQLAQTTMRSELGKIKLDSVFQERMNLNHMIVYAINHAAEAWGICCLRYEIRDIQLPTKVKEAMQMQVEAERKKRANILESEGIRESAVNRAQGLRQSKILASEAVRIEQVNQAKGEASAILARATARASALLTVGKALGAKHGSSAASLAVAEQYVQAFGKLAKTGNTLLLPEKTGDVGSMVAQAMAIYSQMTSRTVAGEEDQEEEEGETRDQLKQVTAEATRDLEEVLSQLSVGIDDLTAERGSASPAPPTQPHPPTNPHFTLADSPTNRRGPEISPPRDPTIV